MNTLNIVAVSALIILQAVLVWRLECHRKDMNRNHLRLRAKIKLADPIKGK